MLKLHVLASGSKGNASIIEDTDTGYGILIDCGISKKAFLDRCFDVSFDPSCITDVLITHEHSDHTKGLGVLMRGLDKLGAHPSLRTTTSIKEASSDIREALKTEGVSFQPFENGDILNIGSVKVRPLATSHDAVESFGFRFEVDCKRTDVINPYSFTDSLTFLTDTGRLSDEVRENMLYCRTLALESNHDVSILKNGPYPGYLKARILSDKGHLSNEQAASELTDLLSTLGGSCIETVIGMHVSQENNTYDLVARSFDGVLSSFGSAMRAFVATQSGTHSV